MITLHCVDPLTLANQVFSSLADSFAAVLAVKGSLRHKRRALDRSGPLQIPAPLGRKSKNKKTSPCSPRRHGSLGFCACLAFSRKNLALGWPRNDDRQVGRPMASPF